MQNKKILIIEDDDILRKNIANNIASRMGLRFDRANPHDEEADIITFINHSDADRWLLDHARDCGLIISDNEIPGQSIKGSQWIMEKLKTDTYRDMPMIYMSGYIDKTLKTALMKAGMPENRIVEKVHTKVLYDAAMEAYNAGKEPSAQEVGGKPQGWEQGM